MKYLYATGALLVFLTIANSCEYFFGTGRLEDKEQTLVATHIAFACDCADWIRTQDQNRFENREDSLVNACFYIEPADSTLELPGKLYQNGYIIEFTGQFYERKGFPKGYESEEMPDRAKVFRYTKYKVIRTHEEFEREN